MGHPSLELTGKVAVVLGGTAGIGRAFSLGLAEAGGDVVACARRAEVVEETAKEIEARGRKTLRVTADVTDRPSLEKARDAVLAAFSLSVFIRVINNDGQHFDDTSVCSVYFPRFLLLFFIK